MTTHQMQQVPGRPNPLATLLVLWAAMLSTQAIFVIIARTATAGADSTASSATAEQILANGPDGALAPATGSLPVSMFAVLAAASVLMAYFVPKMIAKSQVAKLRASNSQIPLEQLVPIAVTTKVIRWALLESVTIYGLILSLVNANPNLILPFAAVALVGFAMTFPSEKGIRGALSVN